MLDLKIYPTQSQKSERGQMRKVYECVPAESKPRANSLPTPDPEPFVVREKKSGKKLWIALNALTRFHSLFIRSTGLSMKGLARRDVPAITIDGKAPTEERSTTAIALDDSGAISETSSILTDTHSALSSEPSAQLGSELESDPHMRIRVCNHCRMLSRMTPVVVRTYAIHWVMFSMSSPTRTPSLHVWMASWRLKIAVKRPGS